MYMMGDELSWSLSSDISLVTLCNDGLFDNCRVIRHIDICINNEGVNDKFRIQVSEHGQRKILGKFTLIVLYVDIFQVLVKVFFVSSLYHIFLIVTQKFFCLKIKIQ